MNSLENILKIYLNPIDSGKSPQIVVANGVVA